MVHSILSTRRGQKLPSQAFTVAQDVEMKSALPKGTNFRHRTITSIPLQLVEFNGSCLCTRNNTNF
jgi:hypothetical protein